jgi:dihydrolipoamide dehydrogenase
VEHLLGVQARPIDEKAVPAAIFTIPEVASVGLTEAEARRSHANVRIGRFDMLALGKAQVSGETTGFVKVVGDESASLLGVHMVGHEVTTMIAEATVALRMKLKMDDIVHTVHAHPTMPEAFHEAALDFFKRAIHKP